MRTVELELPEDRQFFSQRQALRLLGIDKQRFVWLVDHGYFPKGVVRHDAAEPRFNRRQMALMWDYVQNQDEYNAPPGMPVRDRGGRKPSPS